MACDQHPHVVSSLSSRECGESELIVCGLGKALDIRDEGRSAPASDHAWGRTLFVTFTFKYRTRSRFALLLQDMLCADLPS